jgi:sarcosine oxidase subunit beta
VVIAAGAFAAEAGKMAGIDVPVYPDSHEAGVSAPMEQFLSPMVVDLRPGEEGKTANFYFTQTLEGPVIFCYTPKAPYKGTNRQSTSEFLPALAGRMTALIPRLKNVLVRRVWRGLYPMTPDGVPVCGSVEGVPGLYLATGMCGQGFMLGPGIGRNMAEYIAEGRPLIPPDIFNTLALERTMGSGHEEALT